MKVKELIEHLQTLDQDQLIVTAGYEGGWDDIGSTDKKIYEFFRDANKGTWYYGNHEEVVEYNRDIYKDHEIFKAYKL